MVEVIELFSSPPRILPTTIHKKRTPTTAQIVELDAYNFDADVFDSTGNLDFAIERSAKRRRISSKLSQTTA
ncbi:hypothetical protein LTR66_015226, partial [Elasticomyces elasticus]